MPASISIQIQRLPHGGSIPLPAYAAHGAAGMDVVAAEDLVIAPAGSHAVATLLANLGDTPFPIARRAGGFGSTGTR